MQHLNGLVTYLKECHSRVMELENAALQCLESGDTLGYTDKMRSKAEFLSRLEEGSKPILADIPGELRFNLALALERFASSARNALRLNSVFYMSALLYPDEHKPGMPDDLAVFIGRIKQEGKNFS